MAVAQSGPLSTLRLYRLVDRRSDGQGAHARNTPGPTEEVIPGG